MKITITKYGQPIEIEAPAYFMVNKNVYAKPLDNEYSLTVHDHETFADKIELFPNGAISDIYSEITKEQFDAIYSVVLERLNKRKDQ